LDENERRLLHSELAGPSRGQPWAADLELAEYLVRRRETADKCLRGLRRDIDLPTTVFNAQEQGSAAIIDALSRAIELSEVW
jgi:hypothetical protein